MSTEVRGKPDFQVVQTPGDSHAPGAGRRRSWLRVGIYGVLAFAALGVVGAAAWWGHYRYGHVVTRNATVKGCVTDIGVRFDGVVTTVEVDAGQPVCAGDVLARLDDRHLRAELQRARSHLERATRSAEVERLAIVQERRRLETRLSEAKARLAASIAELEAAQSREERARRDCERLTDLHGRGIASEEEFDDAQSEMHMATALLKAAKAAREATEAARETVEVEKEGLAVREAGLAVYDSQVEATRAALAVAEANLEATLIRAPDDGWVVRRIVEAGGSVRVGQPIISLWIGGELWVEAWIDEADLAQVEVGSPAKVTVEPFRHIALSGTVQSIGVLTDSELPASEVPEPRRLRMRGTPAVCVRIRLEDPPAELLPGLSAVVGIRKKAPGFLPAWLTRGERPSMSVAGSP